MALWVTLLVAFMAALASVGAAVSAGIFARKTARATIEAERTRDLESQNSERKYAIYEPMINYLTLMVRGQGNPEEHQAVYDQFSTWIGIYGSDDAVTAFSCYMQAVYNNAPGSILIRLYGDFMLAAREDMGHPRTELSRVKLLALKVDDIYQHADITDLSFVEVCKRHDWRPPWTLIEPAVSREE